MDYRALYRKWRPADFDSVCGQDKITEILKFQVHQNRIGHAYLFCGSRGTGKTSCAKILAKAVNCLNLQNGNPCNECAACRSINDGTAVDVTEMDAASNTGVDHVRSLKEEIVFSPAELRYRVYIIDEVHMISPSAFNALLKTLEEPPSHVIFILATTELHKLPATIVSRCQRFDFRRIDSRVITKRLMHVAKEEKIDLTEEGAHLIARTAQGGMRDALSLLELCAGLHTEINEETAIDILGVGNRHRIFSVISSILEKNYEVLFQSVSELVECGQDMAVFVQDMIDCYRDLMIIKSVQNPENYLDVTDREMASLTDIASRMNMETLIAHSKLLEECLTRIQRGVCEKRSTVEITLGRMCDLRLSADTESLVARISALESKILELNSGQTPLKQETDASKSTVKKIEGGTKEKKDSSVNKPAPAQSEKEKSKDDSTLFHALSYWSDVVETLAASRPSNAGTLFASKAYKNKDGQFRIVVKNDIFARLLKTEESFRAIRNALSEQEGKAVDAANISVEVYNESNKKNLIDEVISAYKDE